MGVLTKASHEFWATVSNGDLDDLLQQEAVVWDWGVAAIEYRADLIRPDVMDERLAHGRWAAPTFVAHFGLGDEAELARVALSRAAASDVLGCICHSRCEALEDVRRQCVSNGRQFATAYHSQQPMTLAEALDEFERQQVVGPLFRKIAVRAQTVDDALAIIEATHRASQLGGSPVVGAVFGPHRWARVALPHAGSAISFLVARQVANEVGGDDEQLQVAEVDRLQTVRALYPSHATRVSSDPLALRSPTPAH